ncbi:MAG: stage III sporulation protein AG [Clostridiaceae bacterium]|nr:stage III sporulation protein AG [Clostridiaceae bacterium]
MGFVKNFNNMLKKLLAGQDKKKILENSIIVIIIGVILIVAGNTIFTKNEDTFSNINRQANLVPDNQEGKGENDNNTDAAEVSKPGNRNGLEEKMEEILSQIKGVGKVSVMITYEAGYEKVPAYDQNENRSATQEEDNNGGKRTITQSNSDSKIAYEEQSGTKKPIILKELEPRVKGVVVVAEGAGEPVVKENLIKAVQALVDIAPHKVQVFEKGT